MGVMSVGSFVFDMGSGDGDPSSSFFRGFIDGGVVQEVGTTFLSKALGDGCGQGGLTVIDMANGTNVQMWFGTVKSGGSTRESRSNGAFDGWARGGTNRQAEETGQGLGVHCFRASRTSSVFLNQKFFIGFFLDF